MTELPGNRETAYRVFAAEFDDATVEHQEGEEERAPNYVVTPTGARANRVFAVGVLTEVESVNDDVLRARVVDPTGAFVVYAGQYQPDEMAALERLAPPAFVAVTGKANTFSPEDADRVYTSIRPESINTVDAATRDRWVVRTAEHTVDRVNTIAAAAELDVAGDALRDALAARDVPARTASGVALALDHYGTTPAYLAAVRDVAVDAARVVAGDLDEVAGETRAPDDAGDGAHGYADLAADLGDAGPSATAATTDTATPETGDAEPATTEEADAPSAGEAAGADATASTDAGAADDAAEDAESDASTAGSTDDVDDDPATEPAAADAGDAPAAEADAGTAADEASVEVDEGDDAAALEDDAAADDDDGVGDFEPGDIGSEATAATDDMYEFDEDEREEIESEYGTEFSSGNDVPEPEDSDLDAPDPEPDADASPGAATDDGGAEESADAGAAADGADDDAEAAAGADDPSEGADEAETADDVDLDAFVMDAMRDLDDGDGVDRDALIGHVVDETGADADAVDDAVQDALMGGQCYEPDDGVLKPI